jgi:hypothetical protein
MLASQADILQFLNSRTGSHLKNLHDAQNGREVCLFLCNIADSPQSESRVLRGVSLEERTSNYQLAKQLFEALTLDFPYDIDRLANLNKNEFLRLAGDLMSLEDEEPAQTETSQDHAVDLEGLMAELEADLEAKEQEINGFQKEITQFATERDFYLSKLLKVEKLSNRYSPADAAAVLSILRLKASELQPSNAAADSARDQT